MTIVDVGEMQTRFQVTDGMALLSQPVLDKILQEAVKRVKLEMAHDARVEDERKLRSRVSNREDEE